MVLVGPSGCGKTTTLRLIAGLEDITSGQITLDGQPMNSTPPEDRDLAMVFQNSALYPHMSVYENMAFGLKLRNVPKSEIDQRIREAAANLGLTALLTRKPGALSGGERRRVALGRAIVRKPKVFLFDEPLSNLDPQSRLQVRSEISRLHQRLGATMIYVTHDQSEAMTIGNRLAVMNQGVIQQVAAPLQTYNEPANLFVAGFIGRMNFFKCTLLEKGGRLTLLADSLLLPVAEEHVSYLQPVIGKQLTVGLRPEDIHPATDSTTTKAHLESIDQLGDETLVHFRTGLHSFTARFPAEMQSRQTVPLQFNMAKALYFDGVTGTRLSASHPPPKAL
jgi:multiple sugar transport system ATP-binding protein